MFERLVPFPAAGQNACTWDFLPMVFAAGVVTITAASVEILKGSSLGPFGRRLTDPWRRAVVFSLAQDPDHLPDGDRSP